MRHPFGNGSIRLREPPALALALATLASMNGCSPGPQTPQSAAVPHNVTLTQQQRQSIRAYTVESSAYRPSFIAYGVVDFDQDRSTQVLAPFSGPVTQLLVTLGERVKPGQPLAKVDSPDFTLAVGAYRKAVAIARAADEVAANDRDLFAHRGISQRENAQAQAVAIGADADRTAALQQLVALHVPPRAIADVASGRPLADADAVIRAPIAGTVVAKSIAPGQTLAAGSTPCFTIADTRTMWVMAQLFGPDTGRVQPGDPAEIDPGIGEQPIAGTVGYVDAVVDPATRAVAARVVAGNPHGLLKQQMYVQVRIRSHNPLHGLLIPVSAVLRDSENLPFVYVVERDGSYARRPVTLGERVGDRFVIPEGLQAGEKIVTDGGIFLRFIQTQ